MAQNNKNRNNVIVQSCQIVKGLWIFSTGLLTGFRKYFYLIWLLKMTWPSVHLVTIFVTRSVFPKGLHYIDIILDWIFFIITINNIKVSIITMIHLKQQTY